MNQKQYSEWKQQQKCDKRGKRGHFKRECKQDNDGSSDDSDSEKKFNEKETRDALKRRRKNTPI